MTSAATMPGNWPPSPPTQTERRERLQIPRLNTQLGESSLRVPTTSTSSPRHSVDELFFDCPTKSSTSTATGSTPSYLIFEPVVESVSDNEPTDWRRYDPPLELLRGGDETSETLLGILEPSVERIRARIVEEDERRATAARRERPLGRKGKASVRPNREALVSMTGALDPLQDPRSGRLSAGSATSLASNDSGYMSMSAEPEPRSAKKPFNISSLFGRKAKPSFSFAALGDAGSSSTADIGLAYPYPPATPIVDTIIESEAEQSSTTECVSCLDDFESRDMIKLTCHSYCAGCFTRLVSTAMESETHWPVKCCLNTIPSTNILPHIDEDSKAKYHQREAEWSIPAGDRVYCSHASCGAWIAPEHISARRGRAKCPKCSRKTCGICRGEWHHKSDCPNDPELQATINLAEREGWRRCISCRAMVEHNQGCRHMTCRCKAEFCYICGLKWRTCACTDAQLATIHQRAETRREQTEAEAAVVAAAAEEERLVLQMVADFEAAEAERLAREAEEQRLREEEERRRVEEERRRQEEERIAAVNLRFRQLTAELEVLHDVQKVRMAERYDFEQERLQKEMRDALEIMKFSHPTEINTLTEESQRVITETQTNFVNEYKVRLEEEQRIEDEYVGQLRRHYHSYPDAEFRVREARDNLRRDQEKEYKFWDSYRRRELQALTEGESRKMEALKVKHASEIKAAEGRAKIDEVEWKRKRRAEGMWVDEILRERATMLQELEQGEYAAGA